MGKITSSMRVQPASVWVVRAEVDAVLANWGRWAAVRMGRSAHVNPLFSRALRGRAWQPCASGGDAVNVNAAWRAERVVCNVLFSPRFRALLTAHYVHAAAPAKTCALLHMAHAAYEAELFKAAGYFWDRLQRLADEA